MSTKSNVNAFHAQTRAKNAHSHCLPLLSSLVLSPCESPTATLPRHVLEHMKSREYISENHMAGDEQVGNGFRGPKKRVTVGVGSCCVLLRKSGN